MFSELLQRHKNVFPIIMHTARLQVNVLLLELGKQHTVHKFSSKTEAVALLEGDIDVSASEFVYYVVVGECLTALLLLPNLIKPLANFVR